MLLGNMEVYSTHLDVPHPEDLPWVAVMCGIILPCPLVHTDFQALHSGLAADQSLAGENRPHVVFKWVPVVTYS